MTVSKYETACRDILNKLNLVLGKQVAPKADSSEVAKLKGLLKEVHTLTMRLQSELDFAQEKATGAIDLARTNAVRQQLMVLASPYSSDGIVGEVDVAGDMSGVTGKG